MPRSTFRLKLSFPDAQEDPWGELMTSWIHGMDAATWAVLEDRNLALLGGGNFLFTPNNNLIAWDADIILTTFATGLVWKIAGPGTIAITDGEVAYVEVDRRPASAALPVVRDVSATLDVQARLVEADGVLIQNLVSLWARRGDNIVFRNGRILPSNTLTPALEVPIGEIAAAAATARLDTYESELSLHRHLTYEFVSVADAMAAIVIPSPPIPRKVEVYREGLRLIGGGTDYTWGDGSSDIVLTLPTVGGENYVVDVLVDPSI